VVDRAKRIVDDSGDLFEIAQANLFGLAGMINLGRVETAECADLIERTAISVQRFPMPSLVAEYHTLRGAVSSLTAPEESLLHTVAARRELTLDDTVDKATWIAWHDLSVVESALSLSGSALAAQHRTEELANRWGLLTNSIRPRLDVALVKDHHGDTSGCVRDLEDLARRAREVHRAADRVVVRSDRLYLGYACARLLALGGDPGVSPEEFLPADRDDPMTTLYRRLITACVRIAAGNGASALRAVEDPPVIDPITGVDVLRLRSLAFATSGEHAAALAHERKMFRVVSDTADRLRRLILSDSTPLRNPYADEPSCGGDPHRPDTAVPDLRVLRFERWPAPVSVGVLNLRNLDEINTGHGYRIGDLVLRRTVEILLAGLRDDDRLARHVGDRFVVILPATTLAEAVSLGERLRGAVTDGDWSRVAPGLTVELSIGWTELIGQDLAEGVRRAERAQLGWGGVVGR
jgi:diguanylate cyclase (GGDEF)-like protein